MVDPITMILDGGFFALFVLFLALGMAACLVLQLTIFKQRDLMPLAWSMLVALLLTGVLGYTMGLVQTFEAVAHASAEMKQTLWWAGNSVARYVVAFSLLLAGFLCIGAGLVATVQRNRRKGELS